MHTDLMKRPSVSDEDRRRMQHTAIRYRMLDGSWERDLNDLLVEVLGEERREAAGIPDQSSNAFAQLARELSVTYDRTPMVRGDGVLGDLVETAGLWTKLQESQRLTWGLREHLVRVDSPVQDDFTFRLVSPHNVVAWSDPDRPDVPIGIKELRLRQDPRDPGKQIYAWDVYSIDLAMKRPYFRVMAIRQDETEDITEAATGGRWEGTGYVWRYADGRPFVPYALRHAADTGRLWNHRDLIEVMMGSLYASVYWTAAGHAAISSSYRTVIIVNAEPMGDIRNPGRPDKVLTLNIEPGSMMFLEGSGDAQPTVTEVGPGADLPNLQDFALQFERRVSVLAGINPADIQRVSDPRSGYAISISNAGKREYQAKHAPLFARQDRELLSKCAAVHNRMWGTSLAEVGHSVEYHHIPKSTEELKAEREDISFDLKNYFITPSQALVRRRPGIDEDEAARIIAENRTSAVDGNAAPQYNGAQLAQIVEVQTKVTSGEMTPAQARAFFVSALGISDEAAAALAGDGPTTTEEQPDVR